MVLHTKDDSQPCVDPDPALIRVDSDFDVEMSGSMDAPSCHIYVQLTCILGSFPRRS
jgi:hypothetical protein